RIDLVRRYDEVAAVARDSSIDAHAAPRLEIDCQKTDAGIVELQIRRSADAKRLRILCAERADKGSGPYEPLPVDRRCDHDGLRREEIRGDRRNRLSDDSSDPRRLGRDAGFSLNAELSFVVHRGPQKKPHAGPCVFVFDSTASTPPGVKISSLVPSGSSK